jgi:hypothetical protein
MRDPNRLLDDIRIASPCTASWNAMTGTDAVRFCGECKLNVYNLSDMTAAEAATLVQRAEGRLCVRLYKRKDGTVLTRKCPVGLRATLARASKAAGAALAMILGLFSGVAARASSRFATAPQDRTASRPFPGQEAQEPVLMGKIAAPRGQVTVSVLSGEYGARLSNARVVLTNAQGEEFYAGEAGKDYRFVFTNLPAGTYTLTVDAPGYVPPKPKTVYVREDKPANVKIRMSVRADVILGGPLVERLDSPTGTGSGSDRP